MITLVYKCINESSGLKYIEYIDPFSEMNVTCVLQVLYQK